MYLDERRWMRLQRKKLDVCKRNMQRKELMDAMVKWEGDGLGKESRRLVYQVVIMYLLQAHSYSYQSPIITKRLIFRTL